MECNFKFKMYLSLKHIIMKTTDVLMTVCTLFLLQYSIELEKGEER